MKTRPLDLSGYTDTAPAQPVHLLFIHHSCGGQLLADVGPVEGEHCIYATHPNGGGLRALLEQNNYIVHEASYDSVVGDKTDVCHWPAKFRDHMSRILVTRHQDEVFADGTTNWVVLFKSCYPNNWIVADGTPPGVPDDCARTSENMKAAYNALLPAFAAESETLFVSITAPPLAEPALDWRRIGGEFFKGAFRRPDTLAQVEARARRFNAWLVNAEQGWLADYEQSNVVVFDLFTVLTNGGASSWSAYPSGNGLDSHPNAQGNGMAAEQLCDHLNRAWARLGESI